MQIINPYMNYLYEYKGQTHCHTKLSGDAKDSPESLMKAYKDKGYGFVCITDHNRYTFNPLVDGVLHIGSGEDGKSDRHHIVALGINRDKLDVSVDKDMDGLNDLKTGPCDNIQPRIDYIARTQGAVAVLAHPTGNHAYSGLGFTLDELLKSTDYCGIEIFNGSDEPPLWSVSSNYHISSDIRSWWDEVLSEKKRGVWGFACDDCHNIKGKHFNRGWIVVNSRLDPKVYLPLPDEANAFERDVSAFKKWSELTDVKKRNIINQLNHSYELRVALTQDILFNIKSGNFYSVVRCPKNADAKKQGTKDKGPVMNITSDGQKITLKTDLKDSQIRLVKRNKGSEKNEYVNTNGKLFEYQVTGNELYVRFEIEQKRPISPGSSEMEIYIAYSQPIFIRQ